ncbi:MAG: hypothetical protein IJB75_08225 [Oscillospiraceae bacterium]|nr:hypothetical protein [Oscillospiraceae bacterium]
MNKREQALATCENVLSGIECDTITVSSALLQCLRIARLIGDIDAVEWLQYEYGGYPLTKSGHIENHAWSVGKRHGRGYIDNKEEYIFTELASELESKIQGEKSAICSFTTQGTSVSGDYAVIATNNLTSTITKSISTLLERIARNEKRLAILKSAYYDYALKKSIELAFSNVAKDIFDDYRSRVDEHFSGLSTQTLMKLQAIEDKVNSGNPEMYSQALTSCRRLFENTAVELFAKYFPDYSEKLYKTKSGKEIDISGDHYINKLSAVIEKLQDKNPAKSLVGSSILYTLDWIENLNSLQCKGVHSEITKQEAEACIIHTYICLGDILQLQENS